MARARRAALVCEIVGPDRLLTRPELDLVLRRFRVAPSEALLERLSPTAACFESARLAAVLSDAANGVEADALSRGLSAAVRVALVNAHGSRGVVGWQPQPAPAREPSPQPARPPQAAPLRPGVRGSRFLPAFYDQLPFYSGVHAGVKREQDLQEPPEMEAPASAQSSTESVGSV
jgi:hypothetical protein